MVIEINDYGGGATEKRVTVMVLEINVEDVRE
jgi:hypothetical protein